MLNPNNDRLDYGQILSPPEGYKLDFAVGTTYSLDFDALVGACLALGLSESTDSDLIKNPICLLEALRATGDKVALFCEGGQIHKPNNVTSLYILLEKMVFQVNEVKNKSNLKHPSFHPKFWLIRYTDNSNNPFYRVAVLSRNLTFDRSWDVSFYMNGERTNKKTKKNEPVCDFLRFLTFNLGTNDYAVNKKERIYSIIEELPYIQFNTGCKEFYDFDFIPTGIQKSSKKLYHSIMDYPIFQDFAKSTVSEGLSETFIMSPFLSRDVIRYFNERNKYISNPKCVLITRAISLGRLKPEDCSKFKIYTMKDAVVDGESTISENDNNYQKQDIHAKVYLTKKYADTDLYIGSLNASHNAVFGNVEFMIRLRSKNRYLNIDKLTESLFGTDEGDISNPFQYVNIENVVDETENDNQDDLDYVIKEINRMTALAYVSANEDFYDVTVEIPTYETQYSITISPLLSNKSAPLSEKVVFQKLNITQLSEFYTVSVSNNERTVSRVIKISTAGIPDDREKMVVTSVVNDKACFYRYIAFLLGDSFVLSALESSVQDETDESHSVKRKSIQIPAIYEKMLHTAATAPERFKEIEYLIQAISDDGVIPEYFEEMYNTFKKVVKF